MAITYLIGEESDPVPICIPKHVHTLEAAHTAIGINPMNRPPSMAAPTPEHLALLTTKYWGQGGVHLTVGFTESIPSDLRDRILSHMNAWSAYCNAQFSWTQTDPQVRISRGSGGYWSYLGTDILNIPAGQQTMNLEGFTMSTAESEFHRVVRHETGHTLGFPHEHMRRELVARIDPAKAIAYFKQTQGWSAQMVQQQVLTPLEDSSLLGTDHADQDSIMCYQLPSSITVDGQPIRGGTDIDTEDQTFAAKVYPKASQPNPPTNPPTNPPPTSSSKLFSFLVPNIIRKGTPFEVRVPYCPVDIPKGSCDVFSAGSHGLAVVLRAGPSED